jgi:hypothetical protein
VLAAAKLYAEKAKHVNRYHKLHILEGVPPTKLARLVWDKSEFILADEVAHRGKRRCSFDKWEKCGWCEKHVLDYRIKSVRLDCPCERCRPIFNEPIFRMLAPKGAYCKGAKKEELADWAWSFC